MSLVMCTPPTGIESEKIISSLIKTPILVISSPRSIIIAPFLRSSLTIVEAPDACGLIINFSTERWHNSTAETIFFIIALSP